ncbi:hypothetical protein [Bradyrhizobium cosmicum]|uniref:hypothetical protein n=1 Tax=Bradyrhizobium cosmicum TaxID=1404864 RepID=UPI0028E5450E|nr:hypothetical protein [Bradyrhizobium cosmicum]
MSNVIQFPTSDAGRVEKTVRDRKDAGAYRQMEGDLRDLVNMGRITAGLAHDADGEPPLCEKRNLALFAVYHLHEMLLHFEMKYEDGDWLAGGAPSTDSATGSG